MREFEVIFNNCPFLKSLIEEKIQFEVQKNNEEKDKEIQELKEEITQLKEKIQK